MEPKINFSSNDDVGFHNIHSADRITQGSLYKDASTICVIPTRGMISAKVVQNWMGLITPMNQKFARCFITGMEVGAAYTSAIEQLVANPDLASWKYVLTLEEDNLPPPDGLIKLIESIQHCDVVSGLYWTKGEGGQPMIYGDPDVIPLNFLPQQPKLPNNKEGEPYIPQRCNGLGMGFTLFKMEIFKNPRLPKPFFKSLQEYIPGVGVKAFTQDLYFFEGAGKLGYKFGVDTRVKVGHYDHTGAFGPAETVW